MDMEQIIEGLEKAKNVIEQWIPIFEQYNSPAVIDEAIELLKEQEAVEPIITPWLENEDGEVIIEKKECGRCGYHFFTEKPNYCENCGRPVLWEGR